MNEPKWTEEKRQWRKHRPRVRSLPKDYRTVYKEAEKYIFKVACYEGVEALRVLPDLLELFENGVSRQREVLEITGLDVAGFCDALMT